MEKTCVELLESVGRRLAFLYTEDPSAPSVTVSLLPSGEWYVSLLRYAEKFGKDKYVVHSCKCDVLATGLEYLLDWLPEVRVDVS